MTILGGALGGLAGIAVGHITLGLAYRWAGDPSLWFKGPHGPAFFDILIFTAVYYAGVGAGASPSGRRAKGAGLVFLAGFLGLLTPLAVGTRIFTWGEEPAAPPTLAWFNLVLGSYLCASILAVYLLGVLTAAAQRWKTGLGALGGAALGYLASLLFFRFFPSLQANPVTSLGLRPPLGALLDGTLNGACISAGIVFTNRRTHDQTRRR